MKKGWQGSLEINRVMYDQELVTSKEIEKRLQATGTYIKTLSIKESEGT